jgi:hypothetical protein
MNKHWKILKRSVVKQFYIVYKITCNCGKIYIGSTRNFKGRLETHRRDSETKYQDLYKCIRRCKSNVIMIPVNILYGSGMDSKVLEQYYIDKFDSLENGLNSHRAYNSPEYYKEYMKEHNKEYYQKNKVKITECVKEYRLENKLEIAVKKKEYYQKNKAKKKEYQQKHKVEIAARKKEYRQKHKMELAAKRGTKHECECGQEYTHTHKARHYRTAKHLAFLASQLALIAP